MAEDQPGGIIQIVEQFGKDRSRLMDIARAVHAKLGCLTEDTIGQIADALGIHRVEVRDMVSFYAFFSRHPQGRTVIRLCNAVVERMITETRQDDGRCFETFRRMNLWAIR